MKNHPESGAVEIRMFWWRPRSLAALALGVLAVAFGCGGGAHTSTGGGGISSGGSSNGGAGGSSGSSQGGGGTNAGGGGSTNTGGGGMAGSGAGGTAGSGAGGMAGAGGSTTTGLGGGQPGSFLCSQPAPAGADMPDALPAYSGGACPALVAGENTITSGGNTRKFLLVLPSNGMVDPNPPVLFLWHWLGGSAEKFVDQGQIQQAVDQQHFVAVVPRAKGDVQFQWPFSVADSDARMNEEYKFFDDMLSCVAAQFKANTNCVGSAGVSAGALFTDQLAAHRANYIASFLSLSGGVGGVIRPWGNPKKKLPGLVLWGGPTDNCFGLLKFDQESATLEDNLTSGGDFFIECIHNCGHSAPPIDQPADGSSVYSSLWEFVLNHPYWLKDGQSPYKDNGLPANMPSWCGIGKGSATPRVGPCNGGGC
jgi:predicted esterase